MSLESSMGIINILSSCVLFPHIWNSLKYLISFAITVGWPRRRPLGYTFKVFVNKDLKQENIPNSSGHLQ